MHIQNKVDLKSPLQDRLDELKLSFRVFKDRMRGYPKLIAAAEKRLGYRPDLTSPLTYNEKIQWLKLNDRNPLYPVIADKYRLRGYLQETLGERRAAELMPDLYMVTDNVRDLTAQYLPAECVIKANHGSGWNIFLYEDQTSDFEAIRRECATWLRRSYGKSKHEWAYQEIPRRIVVEELIKDDQNQLPKDMKFHMIGGKCAFIFVDQDRFEGMTQPIVDEDWNDLPFKNAYLDKGVTPSKPSNFEEMREIAYEIGSQFSQIRVDFLFTENRIILNELTLYRGSGMMSFDPPEWDRTFGDMWALPDH